MTGLGDRLLSRKFWLATSAFVFFALNRQYAEIAQVVIAYLAVQAGVDAFTSYTETRSPAGVEGAPVGSASPAADEEASGWQGALY